MPSPMSSAWIQTLRQPGFLRRLALQGSAAVLLTSHYMADITALCARVILIHHGRLCYDGGLDGLDVRGGSR